MTVYNKLPGPLADTPFIDLVTSGQVTGRWDSVTHVRFDQLWAVADPSGTLYEQTRRGPYHTAPGGLGRVHGPRSGTADEVERRRKANKAARKQRKRSR